MINLISRFEEISRDETAQILSLIPNCGQFHAGLGASERYYVTYLQELMHRTQMSNQLDAFLIYRLGRSDLSLSRQLAEALAEESKHDDYMKKDLDKFDSFREKPSPVAPLSSTEALINKLHVDLDHFGALSNIIWNWYQQWYSDEFDSNIISRAKEDFGENKVLGVESHVNRHFQLINSIAGPDRYKESLFNQIHHALSDKSDLNDAEKILRKKIADTAEYFRGIFQESCGDET